MKSCRKTLVAGCCATLFAGQMLFSQATATRAADSANGGASGGQPLNVVQIMVDQESDGQRDFSVRMTPGTTGHYAALKFECVYRQEFSWEDSDGNKHKKTNEPVSFTYERKDVKLTADLDTQISFRVPVSTEMLRQRFGATTFDASEPVNVHRIKIFAINDDGTTAWGYQVLVRDGPQVMTEKNRVQAGSVRRKISRKRQQ